MTEVEKTYTLRDSLPENSRITLKSAKITCLWTFNVKMDTCAVCRNKLDEPSIEYQANPSIGDSGLSISYGMCGHVFHTDCIMRWLKTRQVCPLCNKDWDVTKIDRIVGYEPL